MSDFVDGDDNNSADTQQSTLWLDAFHNNDDNDNEATLCSDAFNNDIKDTPILMQQPTITKTAKTTTARTMMARTMTDRTTKETSFHCRVNNNVTIGFALAIAATVAALPSLPSGDWHR